MFQTLFSFFLKLVQKYKNVFVRFLVQMKTLKFALAWKSVLGQEFLLEKQIATEFMKKYQKDNLLLEKQMQQIS